MNNENYTRALRRFTIAGTRQIQQLSQEIGSLFQVSGARVEASTCTGKWRGTLDYSLVYEGGCLFLDNIASKHSKGEITKRIIESLEGNLKCYSNVLKNSAEIWQALKEREQSDNERAAEMGLKQYSLKRVGIATVKSHCGWAYIVLEIDGKERLHTETGLNYDILGLRLDSLRNTKEKYYPAGNYKNSDVDFIQGGVGFIFGGGCYTVDNEGITIAEESANVKNVA